MGVDAALATLAAIRDYEARCNERRREESWRIFGHPGAHIPSCAPTDAGRVEVIRAAQGEASDA